MSRIRAGAWRRIGPPFVLKWLHGLRLDVASRDETFEALFRTGEFEPNEFHWLDGVLKPGMTFIDVGANVGLYSLFAARKVGEQGTVLAIEASRREFAKLKRNLELNRLANARALCMAVSDASGRRELRVAAEANAGHNTLGKFIYDHTVLADVETVEAGTLDTIVQHQRLSRVDVVKMDIEGGELAALLGARETLQRFRPKLLLEISAAALAPQGATPHQVIRHLAGVRSVPKPPALPSEVWINKPVLLT